MFGHAHGWDLVAVRGTLGLHDEVYSGQNWLRLDDQVLMEQKRCGIVSVLMVFLKLRCSYPLKLSSFDNFSCYIVLGFLCQFLLLNCGHFWLHRGA